ncbi:PorP/SprF family type IX secretion system membrane protein [Flavisolibacter sp. BT320]|nr:PorP/SprF family type IX secretion system membrane protein [Flavisolibacter longurius]
MKYHYTLILMLTCFLTSTTSLSQDIHFSQFFEAPLYRNPALAGLIDGDVRIQGVYRTQWNSIAKAYKTTSFNAEYKLHLTSDDYLTIAAQMLHDKAGSTNLTTTHFLPAINYHKSLSSDKNIYLSIGFMGGFVQRRIDRSKMTTNSTYEGSGDGESDLLQSHYSYFDGSTGISLNAQLSDNPEDMLVLGAAYHHFNKPKNSFFNNEKVAVPAKLVFSADAKLALDDQFITTVHNDFVKQDSYHEIISGALLGYKMGPYTEDSYTLLSLGVFYRWSDAFIPVVQLDYSSLSFSLSYDVTSSQLTSLNYGKGGFELGVTYTGFLNREYSTINATKCPRF